MTGYTVHTGSTNKFSQGWDRIFTGGAGAKSVKPAAKKNKSAKKAAGSKRRA